MRNDRDTAFLTSSYAVPSIIRSLSFFFPFSIPGEQKRAPAEKFLIAKFSARNDVKLANDSATRRRMYNIRDGSCRIKSIEAFRETAVHEVCY